MILLKWQAAKEECHASETNFHPRQVRQPFAYQHNQLDVVLQEVLDSFCQNIRTLLLFQSANETEDRDFRPDRKSNLGLQRLLQPRLGFINLRKDVGVIKSRNQIFVLKTEWKSPHSQLSNRHATICYEIQGCYIFCIHFIP